MADNRISLDRLKEVLHYEPKTGIWTWLKKTAECANRIVVGAQAGSLMDGYIAIQIDGRTYRAHRLAFFYMTGRWPDPECDHRDLDRANNRWINLREATKAQNTTNRRVRSHSRTGLKGVSWHDPVGKWQARITIDKKRERLGFFDCGPAAHLAYVVAADKAFGEFARAR